MSLFAKCVSLLWYLEVLWKSRWDLVGGGGGLELENPEGRGASSRLGNLDGKEGGKCLPSGVRGVGDFSGITHCHSMFGFVGNFSLT